MTKVQINETYATELLPADRFDAAIKKAISRSPEMRVEYERSSISLGVARLVRKMREEYHLTQSDLASRVNVPQSFISRLENPSAKKEPSIATLAKVMHAFGYNVVIGVERDADCPQVSLEREGFQYAKSL